MMQINHLAQADIEWEDGEVRHQRFWLDTCAGRDQVAMTMLQAGWEAYEPPLPTLIALWCRALHPVFVDVGANTGFYSLLALATGAVHAHAFEPVKEIAATLMSNAAISELDDRLSLHAMALGESDGEAVLYFPLADHGLVETSASLNATFRAHHAEQRAVQVARLDSVLRDRLFEDVPLLIKIDVESREPDVLRGATALIAKARPAVVCEMLPGCDTAFFAAFCRDQGYVHFALDRGVPVASPVATDLVSLTSRDHLFLPEEGQARWLEPLAEEVEHET